MDLNKIRQVCRTYATRLAQQDEKASQMADLMFEIRKMHSDICEKERLLHDLVHKSSEEHTSLMEEFGLIFEFLHENIEEPIESSKGTSSIYIDSVPKISSIETVTITGGIQSSNPEEVIYLEFTREIYQHENNGTLFRINAETQYPRISATEGADPEKLYGLYKYGYLDRVYTSHHYKEFSYFDEDLVQKIREYGQNQKLYIRFYTISPEYTDTRTYPAFHLVAVDKLKGNVEIKVSHTPMKLPVLNKNWVQYKRALGVKAVYEIMKTHLGRNFQVIGKSNTWMLITSGGIQKSQQLFKKIVEIEKDGYESTPAVKKIACRLMGHHHEDSDEKEDSPKVRSSGGPSITSKKGKDPIIQIKMN